jgi:L-rhamnonate dehydratase
MTGVGVSIDDKPARFIIENHFSRFLEGQDPLNIEYLRNLMSPSSVNYDRKGLTIQAISAIDLALWDCAGQLTNQPVYKLLRRKTKGSLPCYAPLKAQKLSFKI